ncbi:hypothetical protein NDU88_003850 [Pleurodeles waltl]|uniref:Uncharacterized protein n=1 Tax=Pleurodeles waltl TaxID=8319 RepID=A0AAV7V158_PLEWA|nr:hypothetical protein NDU88_003850 [Pleurodeles waltl]
MHPGGSSVSRRESTGGGRARPRTWPRCSGGLAKRSNENERGIKRGARGQQCSGYSLYSLIMLCRKHISAKPFCEDCEGRDGRESAPRPSPRRPRVGRSCD